MPTKVSRGLGLLVIAAIGFVVLLAALQMPAESFLGQALTIAGLLGGGVALIGGLCGGLVLLAWGLLRS